MILVMKIITLIVSIKLESATQQIA